jgi:hypothetical protein
VYSMLPVSLCFSSSCVPYVASFSVFFFILCTLCCQFLCVFLRLVYTMLPVSLDCHFLIAPSLFSNVYSTMEVYDCLSSFVYYGTGDMSSMSEKKRIIIFNYETSLRPSKRKFSFKIY